MLIEAEPGSSSRCALQGTYGRALAAGALLVVVLAAAPASGAPAGPASAAPPAPSTELSAAVSANEIVYGDLVSVSGRLTSAAQGAADAPLALQATPFPYRHSSTVARVTSAADGSYTFAGVRLDRDTRLRVVEEASQAAGLPTVGSPASPAIVASALIEAIVDPRGVLESSSLGAGRVRLSLRVSHTPQRRASPVSAFWYVAPRGSRAFRLATVTSARDPSRDVSVASAIVNPPAKRFTYRVCLDPSWGLAMGAPATRRRCPESDFEGGSKLATTEFQGQGSGTPLPAYPSAGAIAAAIGYLNSRAGRTSLAVVDSQGHLSGVRVREHFQTASVVKVMMLVAYLQMLSARHRGLSASDNSLLYPMIHVSDNNAASAVLSIVGGGAVARVAHEAGMSDYAPGIGWWAFTQTSAADQARFLFMLERLIPRRFYAYARGLMSGIEPSQSWGIPPVARPRFQVFFKTGALPSEGLFNEVARLERGGLTFTIAVFTTGDPSMSYGEQTIQGVASALLAHTP